MAVGLVWVVCQNRSGQKYVSFDPAVLSPRGGQELLRSQAPVQACLQVLQELGVQLKQQVDTAAAAAVQTDHLSLCQRLAAVEQALSRQLTALQVRGSGTDRGLASSTGCWSPL